MQFIDTHIHLDADDFRIDLKEVIEEAIADGIQTMLVPNVDSSTASGVIDVCRQYPQHCFSMAGLHPTSVKEDFQREIHDVERMLAETSCVAIGEIGIDLYWDKTYITEQEKAFVYQMNLAKESGFPAVIHSRKSLEEIVRIIKKEKLHDIPAMFHCFPGSVEQAKDLVEMGYYLGIGGVVTFKNASMAEVAKKIPLEYLLLETDAPWLAPVPWRGKRNEPKYIRLIAEKIAEIKGVQLTEVAEKTTAAAHSLFSKVQQQKGLEH